MSYTNSTAIRTDDLFRHLQDLRDGTYEGRRERGAKEALYRQGIELLSPIAVAMLEEANRFFLNGEGEVRIIGPKDDGSGGLETLFELSWPEQRTAHIAYNLHKHLPPVRIVVNYSQNFLHPHLAASTAGYWPFQVTSEADAERQQGILASIVELELHQRIYETDWRIIPVSSHISL